MLRIRIETGLKEVVVLVQNRARKVEAGGADLESRLAGLELGGGDADGDGDGDEKKVVEEEEEQVPDPLRQFGILVPQTLRTAQGGFESAVEIMMQIVGVQRELVGLEGMIRDQRIRMKDGD